MKFFPGSGSGSNIPGFPFEYPQKPVEIVIKKGVICGSKNKRGRDDLRSFGKIESLHCNIQCACAAVHNDCMPAADIFSISDSNSGTFGPVVSQLLFSTVIYLILYPVHLLSGDHREISSIFHRTLSCIFFILL